jgi:multidrug efflux pump subunit AcrA (membrane-fusion protein)
LHPEDADATVFRIDPDNNATTVFRIDPDKTATRVMVRFGVVASELAEIKSGLRKGDKVIVTDMSRYDFSDRIRLE